MSTSNLSAAFSQTLTYTGFDGETITAPPLETAVPYSNGATSIGGIDIDDGENCDTEFEVNFGSINAATGVEIHNRAYVDVAVRLSGNRSATGTLESGAQNINLPFAHGERLYVESVDSNGGDTGRLSVIRISPWCVNVTSYGDSGVVDTDVSDVKVHNNAPMALPNGGIIVVAMPRAAQCSHISQAQIITTVQQPRNGAVGIKLFGDPA